MYNSGEGVHILVFPYPAQGHMLPISPPWPNHNHLGHTQKPPYTHPTSLYTPFNPNPSPSLPTPHGVRFVWVIKPLTAQQVADGYGSVPDGFEDRVSGRGVVIMGWAPQVAILSHRAMGGFVSHCVWNSVLEGIVAGVMRLGWPMKADQYVNARLSVEDLRAAVRVCEGADEVPDSAELARVICQSMSESTIEKEKAKQLRDKALEAVKASGSSKRNLDSL